MVQMQVTDDNELDVIGLEADLLKLSINRHVRRIDRFQSIEKVSPIARIFDDPIVVAGVEEHVTLRVPDDKEANRDLDGRIERAEVLQNALADGEGTGTEDIKLDVLRLGLGLGCDGQATADGDGGDSAECSAQHLILPKVVVVTRLCLDA